MLRYFASVMTALALFAAPTLAADPTTPSAPAEPRKMEQQSTTSPATPPGDVVTQQKPTELRANSLIGMRVQGGQDQKIGKVHDLVIDENGRISAAVISIGGFLGIGDKQVAVPWQKVRVNGDEKAMLVDMSRDELVAAPEFRTKEAIEADRLAEAARQRAQQQQLQQQQQAPRDLVRPPSQKTPTQ